jgi:CubicO group peptidase (beta-lactamase class C family)
MLYDEGRIQLDDPIARYIPPFADVKVFAGKEDGEIKLEELRRPITIRHLLTHTAGIGHDALFGSPLASVYRKAELARPDQTLEEMVERLVQLPLLHQPGEGWNYSISTDVLARLVEVVSGRRFDEFLRERIFEPLDMVDTGFWVPDYDLHRLATVYSVERNGRLKAVDTAVSSPYSRERTYLSGSAGLASTPIDFYRFAQMLLSGGEWGGVRILQPETVALMTRNHLPESLLPYRMPWRHVQHYTDGCGFGLGVRVVLDLEAWGLPGSVGEYGWAGATNTYVWIDPVQEMVLLLFTQLVPFMHWPLDREFKRLVYEAIEQ